MGGGGAVCTRYNELLALARTSLTTAIAQATTVVECTCPSLFYHVVLFFAQSLLQDAKAPACDPPHPHLLDPAAGQLAWLLYMVGAVAGTVVSGYVASSSTQL